MNNFTKTLCIILIGICSTSIFGDQPPQFYTDISINAFKAANGKLIDKATSQAVDQAMNQSKKISPQAYQTYKAAVIERPFTNLMKGLMGTTRRILNAKNLDDQQKLEAIRSTVEQFSDALNSGLGTRMDIMNS